MARAAGGCLDPGQLWERFSCTSTGLQRMRMNPVLSWYLSASRKQIFPADSRTQHCAVPREGPSSCGRLPEPAAGAELTCLAGPGPVTRSCLHLITKRFLKKALSFHDNKALKHTSKWGFWDSCIPFKNSPPRAVPSGKWIAEGRAPTWGCKRPSEHHGAAPRDAQSCTSALLPWGVLRKFLAKLWGGGRVADGSVLGSGTHPGSDPIAWGTLGKSKPKCPWQGKGWRGN